MANLQVKDGASVTKYLKASGAGDNADPHVPEHTVGFITPATAALSTGLINASASGDNTLITAIAGQTIRVHKLFLICNGPVNMKFKDGGSTDLTPAMSMYSGGGIVLDLDGEPWFVTTAGNGFVLNLSSAVQVSGRIYYKQS